MEMDFHYYNVFQLARLAGFSGDEPETIAYASQYVDNATESTPVRIGEDHVFDPARTAHYQLEAFDWGVQKKIYMPFHFLPSSVRRDSGPSFSYVATPATGAAKELATMLVEDAAAEPNEKSRLIRLGIALHTVGDTFAHFNFSGRHHAENNVRTIWHWKKNDWDKQWVETYGDIAVPRIGHAEAWHNPDYPYLRWRYTNHRNRPVPRENLQYTMGGSEFVYSFLQLARNDKSNASLKEDHPSQYREINNLFRRQGSTASRCERWQQYTGAREYKETTWRDEALEGETDWNNLSRNRLSNHLERLQGKPGFDDSKWAWFHRGAFRQRSLVLDWIN